MARTNSYRLRAGLIALAGLLAAMAVVFTADAHAATKSSQAVASAAAARDKAPVPTCPKPFVFSGKKARCVPCPPATKYAAGKCKPVQQPAQPAVNPAVRPSCATPGCVTIPANHRETRVDWSTTTTRKFSRVTISSSLRTQIRQYEKITGKRVVIYNRPGGAPAGSSCVDPLRVKKWGKKHGFSFYNTPGRAGGKRFGATWVDGQKVCDWHLVEIGGIWYVEGYKSNCWNKDILIPLGPGNRHIVVHPQIEFRTTEEFIATYTQVVFQYNRTSTNSHHGFVSVYWCNPGWQQIGGVNGRWCQKNYPVTAPKCEDHNASNFGQPLPCVYPKSPPPTCQDRNATNFGGPLPCTYPPPPAKCTDTSASNYGQVGQCTYPPRCTDQRASNYGQVGSCVYPPPPTCQDRNATNFGGPLPCTYPPPPSKPVHHCTPSHSDLQKDERTATFSVTCDGPISSALWTFSGNGRQVSGTTVNNTFPDSEAGKSATGSVTVYFTDGADSVPTSTSISIPAPPPNNGGNPAPPPLPGG